MNYHLSLPAPVSDLLGRLTRAGFSAYVVGGCVRDSLLGLEPHDWDICTSALPDQMQEVFRNDRTVDTGLKHGTLMVIVDHEPYEVTTFRVDGDYTDHRHPDSVVFVDDLTKDLARRDFTVNAMAWSPETGLQDPFEGQLDLSAKLIRCGNDGNTYGTQQRYGDRDDEQRHRFLKHNIRESVHHSVHIPDNRREQIDARIVPRDSTYNGS